MPMTIYKLFATGSASADSASSLDIQLDGEIMAIHMTGKAAAMTGLADGWHAELSFLSSNTFSNSDVRGSLMIIQASVGLLTSGALNTGVNAQISSLNIPVNAGERIHLHIGVGATPGTMEIHAYLFVSDKGVARIPGRRR